MSTPRKTTPRKTAAAAVPAEETQFEKFGRFRARASNLTVAASPVDEIEPFVLGEDDGFDPPIAVQFPKDLEHQYLLDRALRAQDHFGVLEILMGGELRRVLRVFSAHEDGAQLLVGLVYTIMDHYLGRGGTDVPGGSQPS